MQWEVIRCQSDAGPSSPLISKRNRAKYKVMSVWCQQQPSAKRGRVSPRPNFAGSLISMFFGLSKWRLFLVRQGDHHGRISSSPDTSRSEPSTRVHSRLPESIEAGEELGSKLLHVGQG